MFPYYLIKLSHFYHTCISYFQYMIGCLVNNELEEIWQEALAIILRRCPALWQQGTARYDSVTAGIRTNIS